MKDMAGFGAMDVIVAAALLFTLALVVAWACSGKLRAWIERPKYRFMANVAAYDRDRAARSHTIQ